MFLLLVALAQLTRIPVPAAREASPTEQGQAVPWYPAAGLILGICVAVPAAILQGLPAFLAATLAVALWLGLTGAAPLQGLADAVDGYVGGHGNRRRTLSIMHNHKGGVGAIAAAVLVVLAKTVALGCLIRHGAWGAVVAAPLAGRILLAGVLATTPPAPDEPTDRSLSATLDRAAVLVGVFAGLGVMALLMGLPGLAVAGGLLALIGLLRWVYKRTVGGFTGDLLGAACEAGELAALGIALWALGSC